ncbi:MAG: hypothetical protein WD042_03845 [Phycisphaeraceae bacterium]
MAGGHVPIARIVFGFIAVALLLVGGLLHYKAHHLLANLGTQAEYLRLPADLSQPGVFRGQINLAGAPGTATQELALEMRPGFADNNVAAQALANLQLHVTVSDASGHDFVDQDIGAMQFAMWSFTGQPTADGKGRRYSVLPLYGTGLGADRLKVEVTKPATGLMGQQQELVVAQQWDPLARMPGVFTYVLAIACYGLALLIGVIVVMVALLGRRQARGKGPPPSPGAGAPGTGTPVSLAPPAPLAAAPLSAPGALPPGPPPPV